MPSRFVCPHCGASGRLPDGFAGDKIKCPACKTISRLDAGGTPGATQPNPPSSGEPRSAARVEPQEYALEESWQAADEPPSEPAAHNRPNPGAKPGPSRVKASKRVEPDHEDDDDEATGPPVAIIGAAAAGVLALMGGLVFVFGPWSSRPSKEAPVDRQPTETTVAAQPQTIAPPQALTVIPPPQGITPGPAPFVPAPFAPPPAPFVSGPINNVANVQGNLGALPPAVPGAAAPGPVAANAPGGMAPNPVPGGPPPAPADPPIPGPGGGQAIAQIGAAGRPATPDDPVRRIQDATVYLNVQVGRVRGSGTGFVIRSDGDAVLIATNDHVINPHLSRMPRDEDSPQPMLTPTVHAVFRSGGGPGVEETHRAEVLAYDGEENRDLAILRVRRLRNPPQPISLSELAEPKLLMPVIIYGFPFGNIDRMLDQSVRHNPSITVNRGAVSSMKNDQNNRLSHIQIDGSINHGNSGGPVVDESGRLVGIAVAKIENTNIGFAIPAAELTRMLEGRIGPVGLKLLGEQGGRPRLEARARLIDPLNHVQFVQVLIAPAGSTPGGSDKEGNWPALSGAQAVDLNARFSATARASFTLEFPLLRSRRLMVQPVYRLDTGRLVHGMPTPFVIDAGSKTVARDLGKADSNVPAAGFAALGALVDARGQPVKDCKVEKDASSLTIEVPAGVRAFSPKLDVHTAPLMLTDVEGDFIAQVRVTGNMVPGTSPPKFKGRDILPNTYQGAGLVLLQDARNYIRVERSVSADRGKPTLRTRALIEIVKGGRVISVIYPRIPDGDLHIRIQRINGAVTCLFGPNGKFWLTHEKLAIAVPPRIKVGLIASNMSRVPLNAQFEHFVLITEKKDVDAEKSEQ